MNYKKIHDELVSAMRIESPLMHKHPKSNPIYKELHHIIPKCLFDNKKDPLMNIPENKIYVTPRVHFILHHLLTKIHCGNSKLQRAFNTMFTAPNKSPRLNNKEWRKVCTARTYDYHRSKMKGIGDNVSPERRKQLADNYRGFRHSEETKQLMSKIKMGKPIPLEVRQKMSATHTGLKKTEEHKKNIGLAHKGKTISQEHRDSISQTLSTKKYLITHPDGHEEEIDNLNKFCKLHQLSQGNMAAVLAQRKLSCKGFKVRYL